MAKKQRRPLVQDTGPLAVSNGAPFAGGADASADLYDAWKGQVRVLDEQPAAEPEDAAGDMLRQLRAVADELEQPAPRFSAPKLLSSTDRNAAADARVDQPAAAPAPVVDVSAIQRSIDSLAARLEVLLVKSQDQLAARVTQAVNTAGDRHGLVHSSVLSDAQTQLEATQQQIEQLTAQLDDARSQIERARAQQNDTVERLVERTTELAQLHAEYDASRDAAWEGALQRAIGMLSVLESLDDVIVTLRIKPDRKSTARLQHFEREARKMAQLVELEEIATVGCVDPDQHEIVSTVGGKARTGTIVEVRQRGYSFRGRILRRAQVVVSARD
ncbi:MAG TPA: nucleotide exchange factor GrpE [Gemmatimonadaceae bacterium]|jgi:molecular chaperone GrpE (heat shock protein)